MRRMSPASNAIAVFGTAPYDDSTNELTFRMARVMYELSADVRRTGSAALDLCWTACGRFGLYAELSLSLWYFAAGKLIAEETGCIVTDIHGDKLNFHGKTSILMRRADGDPGIHGSCPCSLVSCTRLRDE